MAIRVIGKAVVISVNATTTVSADVGTDVNDYCCKAAFLNTGTTDISILAMAKVGTAVGALLPTTTVPSMANIILPHGMTAPVVFVTPPCPFSVSAIGSAFGPGTVFITPCEE